MGAVGERASGRTIAKVGCEHEVKSTLLDLATMSEDPWPRGWSSKELDSNVNSRVDHVCKDFCEGLSP